MRELNACPACMLDILALSIRSACLNEESSQSTPIGRPYIPSSLTYDDMVSLIIRCEREADRFRIIP